MTVTSVCCSIRAIDVIYIGRVLLQSFLCGSTCFFCLNPFSHNKKTEKPKNFSGVQKSA